jgi:3-methyladenine DNA glycosylase AlkD
MSTEAKAIAYLEKVNQCFEQHRNDENAKAMSAYMKNHFSFFGIKSPERRALSSALLKQQGLPEYPVYRLMLKEALKYDEREIHHFTLDLFLKYKKHWEEKDAALLEYIITHKSWWDSVDLIAIHFVGAFLLKFPHLRDELINRWNKSDHLWLQRSSIIFQIRYKAKTDELFLARNIQTHISSKEFFLQKAIGWALREYAYHRPDWVRQFVASNSLANLSKREALRVIDKKK